MPITCSVTHSNKNRVIPVLKGHIERANWKCKHCWVVHNFIKYKNVIEHKNSVHCPRLPARLEQNLVIRYTCTELRSSALYTQTTVCCAAHCTHTQREQGLRVVGKMVQTLACWIGAWGDKITCTTKFTVEPLCKGLWLPLVWTSLKTWT